MALAERQLEVATEATALHEHECVLERRPHVLFKAIGERLDEVVDAIAGEERPGSHTSQRS